MGVDRAAAREVVLIFPSAPRLCTRLVTLESVGSPTLPRVTREGLHYVARSE